MFGPLPDVLEWLKEHNPGSPFKKRHLSFITIHYLYLISVTIIGSILLYPAGGLAYVDALFFASGSATQSGLNTVNINELCTYQQVIFYFIGMVCTPIFINTFVVFVRLYWFERRFQSVVAEARNFKRTKSRTRGQLQDDTDPGLAEKGVRGRSIVVMHNGDPRKFREGPEARKQDAAEDLASESQTDSSSSQRGKVGTIDHADGPPPQRTPTFRRDITFADEVKSLDDDDSTPRMLPQRLSPEQHIEFLENQRNPKEKKALRIPGPRDFDRGRVPEPLDSDEEDGGQLRQQDTGLMGEVDVVNDAPLRRNVTIDAPDHPRLRANPSGLPRLSTRKSGTLESPNVTSSDDVAPQSARLRARTGTFSSLRNWASKENNDPVAPYLSWQPTIGRNSAFVDLTEEQREELGGIEYRALKTLAVVLVFFPIAISVRRTNVYEEKSLGIYGTAAEAEADDKEPSYVSAHLRRQLGFDLWYVFLGLFIIAVAEGDRLANTNDYAFTLFSVLFEIVSAYGTVGLSLGYPNIDASLSAEFNVISKLVIIAMQIRGRHRGLPYELDRAILLPSDSLHKKEDADASQRMQRRNSSMSNVDGPGPGLSRRTSTAVQPPAMTSLNTAVASGRDGGGNSDDLIDRHESHSGHVQKGLGRLMAGLAEGPNIKSQDGVVPNE
ncbi:Trk/Ktr/HKT type cation transporter, partial [Lecanoromycetidae sp. Uapishka_2]